MCLLDSCNVIFFASRNFSIGEGQTGKRNKQAGRHGQRGKTDSQMRRENESVQLPKRGRWRRGKGNADDGLPSPREWFIMESRCWCLCFQDVVVC